MAKNALAKVDTFTALAPIGETNSPFSQDEVMGENLGAGGLSPNDLDKVKIPSGGGTAWEIPTLDGKGDIAKDLDVIIVAKRDIRAYYSTRYDGSKNPPDCFSDDCITGVGNPGGICDTCEFAQWCTATDDNGNPTNGQACSQRMMLLCIGPDSTIPFVISVPPSSLKTIKPYLIRLSGARRPFWSVVTKLSLSKTEGTGIAHSVVNPEFVRELTDEEIPAIRAYRESLLPMFNMVTADRD